MMRKKIQHDYLLIYFIVYSITVNKCCVNIEHIIVITKKAIDYSTIKSSFHCVTILWNFKKINKVTLSHNTQNTTTETLELSIFYQIIVLSVLFNTFSKKGTIYVHEFLIQFLLRCVSVGNFYNFINVD